MTEAISRTAETALDLACRHLLREAARRDGPDPRRQERAREGLGPRRARHGQAGCGRTQLLLRRRPSSCSTTPSACVAPIPDELQSIFVKLVRNLVKIMEARDQDGYVFRTDLRLRPDPAATPMALSTLAAETYYESIGQNWERAAMIKARAVAGDREAGEKFLAILRPFVWRRHLDFAAIADIHAIKRQIQAHRGRRGDCTSRPQREGRARRHPRDRVLRADPAADLGRPRSRASRARDDPGAEGARRRGPREGRGGRRSRTRLCVPAHARTPPADDRRRADADAARRPG